LDGFSVAAGLVGRGEDQVFEVDEEPIEAAGGGLPVGVCGVAAGGGNINGLDGAVEDIVKLMLMAALEEVVPIRTEGGGLMDR